MKVTLNKVQNMSKLRKEPAIHNLGRLTVQYIREVDRLLVKDKSGMNYYTNSFSIVRKEFKKYQKKQLSLFEV